MPDLSNIQPVPFIVVTFMVAAAVLLIQAVIGLFSQYQTKTVMNRRLMFRDKVDSTDQLIIELRRQRALNEDGSFTMGSKWFNSLVTRSGLVFKPFQWAMVSLGVSAMLTLAVMWKFQIIWPAIGGGIFVCLVGPIMFLRRAAKKRAKKLSTQLTDALQIVTRSLEAGHPVPTAVSLVAREMPDPIGTEFGMAADEMAYGISLTKSVERMAMRCGDQDVDLFAATVRLQERTGGNLCDLLKNNTSAIRERQTLRLKIKAASSEGRASAMILTAAPFIVATAIHFMRPEFYGEVIHVPLMQYCLAGFGLWMLIGNIVMNRMINFRF